MKRTKWSKMSDLSLSEISNMAVINLEIWPQDLWNAKYYTEAEGKDDAVSGRDQRESFQTIAEGDYEAVKKMLDAGASLEAVDDTVKGLLH